jgi:long-chain acyl-CoA synthetase
MILALWLQRQAQVRPRAPAVAWGTELVHDQASLARAAGCCAAGWRERGLQAGDRIAIWMSNAPDHLVAIWSAWWADLIVVPINARLHAKEAAWIIGHSGARACVADAVHAE